MLSFLGLCNYSRYHVCDFAELTLPLRKMVNTLGIRNLTAPLVWTDDTEQTFIALKQCLSRASSLATNDYTCPFYLDVAEKTSIVSAVLYQEGGDGNKSIGLYASTPLEKYEQHLQSVEQALGLNHVFGSVYHPQSQGQV